EQEMVLITNKGTLVRTRVAEVSVVGRNTQGVKLINVGKGELVVGLAVVDIEEEEVLEDEVVAETAESTTNAEVASSESEPSQSDDSTDA
ncbi:MAG: DNA gyrase C-terminal beta-propeller domain-containing protein, partial [Pseudomonadota bacterium]|nr:DNA gyrase C-terminal beta-propeller domain-containing protein [Pseudomonadota bacterium]